jgi:hypothetical protein
MRVAPGDRRDLGHVREKWANQLTVNSTALYTIPANTTGISYYSFHLRFITRILLTEAQAQSG